MSSTDKAIKEAEEVMKLWPNKNTIFGGAYIERGKAYALLNRNGEALADFEKAKQDRNFRESADYQIAILKKKGD